ncbi:MAG TPA: glutaredoxin domain-containing protein [Dehalococcoidia bacterium]|nr:glutaredoxin domain-containing protein [Dehalococcoidia bacterium]
MTTETRQHEVVLFTQGFCEFSEMVRLHLESRGQKYRERDLDYDPSAREDMMKLGGTGTPVTVIDGEVILGYDEEAIDELLGFEPYNPSEDLSGPTMEQR